MCHMVEGRLAKHRLASSKSDRQSLHWTGSSGAEIRRAVDVELCTGNGEAGTR